MRGLTYKVLLNLNEQPVLREKPQFQPQLYYSYYYLLPQGFIFYPFIVAYFLTSYYIVRFSYQSNLNDQFFVIECDCCICHKIDFVIFKCVFIRKCIVWFHAKYECGCCICHKITFLNLYYYF